MALGAFLAGALVAESGAAKIIEHRVEPVRDVFAAVFFVSVGHADRPGAGLAERWPPVLVLTVVVVVGKMVGVVDRGVPRRQRRAHVGAGGMSLAQIGEFSFIIAGVGLSLGVTRHFLYPVAVAVSALTTLLTPWLIRCVGARRRVRRPPAAAPAADVRALYGAWVNGLRATREHRTAWARIRRLVVLLVGRRRAGRGDRHRRRRCRGSACCGSRPSVAPLRPGDRAPAAGRGDGRRCIVPFILGAIRIARALGVALAAEALPAPGAARASWTWRRRRGARCW